MTTACSVHAAPVVARRYPLRRQSRTLAQASAVSPHAALVGGAGGMEWVTTDDGNLWRLSRSESTLDASVAVGSDPVGLAEGAGSLWVAVGHGAKLVRIDPRTAKVEARVPLGNDPSVVASRVGAVWVAVAYPHAG
jgi:streptogramin lyase